MAIQTSYSHARANLASLLDRVVKDREAVIIRRRGSKDVVMISAEELAGLEETAHLLRSPRNAARLLAAMDRALGGKGRKMTVERLRREVGLGGQE